MDELNKNENEQEELDCTEEIAEKATQETEEAAEETIVAAEEAAEETCEAAEEEKAFEEPSEEIEEQGAMIEDKLVAELEGIREMLQNELDGNSDTQLIQELDEIVENEETTEEQEEKRLCECCGERECDTSFGEDYPYCTECRNIMKASPIRFPYVFTALVMAVVAFLSLYLCSTSIEDYTSLLEAQDAYSENNLSDAEYYYEAYFGAKSTESNISRNALRNFLDIALKLGYYNYADQLVSDFFTEKQLQLPWNKKYASIHEEYQKLIDTSTAINEVLGAEIYYGGEFDLKEKIDGLDALIKDKDEKNYSEILIEYYKFAAMNLADEKIETQLEQLDKVVSLDKDGNYSWLYLRNITAMAGMSGDIELTEKYVEQCIKLNKQEYYAYDSLAKAYRMSDDCDADKLLEIAEKAEKATPAMAAPNYRQIYAIAYLLKGNNEEALKQMEAYMETQQYTVPSVNLYALCCLAADDNEGYEEAKSILASGGYDIAKSVQKYKSGKFTIEQVIKDNGGEI